MATTPLQAKLRAGIAAVRAGDRTAGRALLLEVVTEDERIEPAWLWLSQALDDPADQVIALENVLTLNPGNAPARQRLSALRAQLGRPDTPPPARLTPLPAAPPRAPSVPAPKPEPAPSPARPPATPPIEEDDPLQCPYCGQITAGTELQCPHCRRRLLAPGRWQGGNYLYFLLLLFGLDMQTAIFEPAWVLAIAALNAYPFFAHYIAEWGLAKALSAALLPILTVRFLMLAGALAFFLLDLGPMYLIGAAAFTLDVAAHLAAWKTGALTGFPLWLNLGVSGACLLITAAALVSQNFARRRLLTTLERGLHSSVDYARRGRAHLRQGRAALAALHFRKALVLAPKVLGTYKELAQAQAQLGRTAQARQTLEAGAFRAPDDPDFPRLLAALEKVNER